MEGWKETCQESEPQLQDTAVDLCVTQRTGTLEQTWGGGWKVRLETKEVYRGWMFQGHVDRCLLGLSMLISHLGIFAGLQRLAR
jgi:hypothetical protein